MSKRNINAASPARHSLRLFLQGRSEFDCLPAVSTLRRWVHLALEGPAELTLRFVDAREGRQLNRQFRGKDYATNVLTFDYQRSPVVNADIVLCVPVLQREAREQGKSLRAHLAHLVLHGVLHAQGYEHEQPRDAEQMEQRERELLQHLRIADPYLS